MVLGVQLKFPGALAGRFISRDWGSEYHFGRAEEGSLLGSFVKVFGRPRPLNDPRQ